MMNYELWIMKDEGWRIERVSFTDREMDISEHRVVFATENKHGKGNLS